MAATEDKNLIYCYKGKKDPEERGTVYYTPVSRYPWQNDYPWIARITNRFGLEIFSDRYASLRGAQTQLGRHSTAGMKKVKTIEIGGDNHAA